MTNLWKCWLNWSLILQESNERKKKHKRAGNNTKQNQQSCCVTKVWSLIGLNNESSPPSTPIEKSEKDTSQFQGFLLNSLKNSLKTQLSPKRWCSCVLFARPSWFPTDWSCTNFTWNPLRSPVISCNHMEGLLKSRFRWYHYVEGVYCTCLQNWIWA